MGIFGIFWLFLYALSKYENMHLSPLNKHGRWAIFQNLMHLPKYSNIEHDNLLIYAKARLRIRVLVIQKADQFKKPSPNLCSFSKLIQSTAALQHE